jgi:hypothetical protein
MVRSVPTRGAEVAGGTARVGAGQVGIDCDTDCDTDCHWSWHPIVMCHDLIGPYFLFKFKYSHLNSKTSHFLPPEVQKI